MADSICPDCHSERDDWTKVCPQCGAPPVSEHRLEKVTDRPVRTTDLEPYVALRYIARLFKVLAVLMILMMAAEIVTAIFLQRGPSIGDIIARTTQMLVLAGLMWAGGDLTLLAIDLGHDIRVARILLGRINSALHEREQQDHSPSAERRAKM